MIYPPGPASFALRQSWAWVRRPHELLQTCQARYGVPFTLRFVGNRKMVIVTDEDSIKQAFRGPLDLFESGQGNKNFRHFVGENSIFVLDGEAHRRHRRLLMPPFKGERMRAYGELMRDNTIKDLEGWPRGTPFRALEAMSRITVELIFQAIFGIEDTARSRELTGLVAKLASGGTALLAFIAPLRVNLGPWSPWGRFLRTRSAIDAIIFDEIKRARAEAEGRTDILARLIVEGESRGDGLSDQELRDELLTLLGAGHETTATALAWALQWVLGLPEVKAKLEEELREVVGDGLVEVEHLPKLKYLSAVIDETLRLHEPIPIVLRGLARPAEIAGYRLPAGTVVCPSIHLVHRDPERYPDPLAFRPERFLGRRPGPFAYFPFGGGARICIGFAFALFQMKVMLATLLTRADLRLVGQPSLRYGRKGIVVVPANGTELVLEGLR